MSRKEIQIFKNKNIELVMLYFKYRNIFDIGFQSYKIFKNMIMYITNIKNQLKVRNIFEIMLLRKYFKVKMVGKSRFYIFNPHNKKLYNINNKVTIYFN